MNTYLRNTITGLFFDGAAFNASNIFVARPVDAHAATHAHHLWQNVEVVSVEPAALIVDGLTSTTATR